MLYPSLFQHPFFAPTRVIVVSEERLQAAERQAKEEQIEALDVRIEELTKYRSEVAAELKKIAPSNSVNLEPTTTTDA